jgi:hypothetical protein
MKPFSSPNYDRNLAKHDGLGCVCCGKPVKPMAGTEDPRYEARVVGGGTEWGTQEQFDGGTVSGDMGIYPVGPDCAKVLRSLGVFVKDNKS